MKRKEIISLTIECSLNCFSAFIDLLECHQNTKSGLYERKSIRTTNTNQANAGTRCVVCLFGVTDSLEVMVSVARQLKAINTLHNSPIYLKAFSVTHQEQHS